MSIYRAPRAIALLAKCAVFAVPAAVLAVVGFDAVTATPEPVSRMISGTGVMTLLVVTRRRLRIKSG